MVAAPTVVRVINMRRVSFAILSSSRLEIRMILPAWGLGCAACACYTRQMLAATVSAGHIVEGGRQVDAPACSAGLRVVPTAHTQSWGRWMRGTERAGGREGCMLGCMLVL